MDMLVQKIVSALKGVLDGAAGDDVPPPGDDAGLLGGEPPVDGGDDSLDDLLGGLGDPGGDAGAPPPDAPPPGDPETDQYAAGVASGTGTFAPGMTEKKTRMGAGSPSKANGGVARYAAADIDEIKRENKTLRDQVGKILRYNRNVTRRQVLLDLHGDGYNLDVDQEVKEQEDASDEAFDLHVKRIKERYGRRIDGQGFIRTSAGQKRDDVVSTAEEVSKIVDYATAHGLAFHVARQQMKEKGLA
jgi:hypothetical protein